MKKQILSCKYVTHDRHKRGENFFFFSLFSQAKKHRYYARILVNKVIDANRYVRFCSGK